MYVDDTVIFIKPIKSELDALTYILHGFGKASRLQTNIQKSSFLTIRCDHMNLNETICNFPATSAFLAADSYTFRPQRPKYVFKDLDRIRKMFLWAGGENLMGGKM